MRTPVLSNCFGQSSNVLVTRINLPEHFIFLFFSDASVFKVAKKAPASASQKSFQTFTFQNYCCCWRHFHNWPLSQRCSAELQVSVGSSVFAYRRLRPEIELGVKCSTVITKPGEKRADYTSIYSKSSPAD